MNIAAGLIRLNPGAAEHVEKWKTTIESRRSETIQTLIEEGVLIESWFQIDVAGEPHLLWYMRKTPEARFHEVYNQSTHEIDQFHAEIMAMITADHYIADPLLDLDPNEDT